MDIKFEPNKWYHVGNQTLCFIKETADSSGFKGYMFKTAEGKSQGFLDTATTPFNLAVEEIEDKDIPLMGRKYDGDKLRWGLLPWKQVEEIVKVLTYGAKKYAPNNWMYVPGGRWRYEDAMFRHLTAWINGEYLDPETNLPHWAHAGCCLLFRAWIDMNPDKEVK